MPPVNSRVPARHGAADRGLRAHRRHADRRAGRHATARSTGSALPRFDSGACFAALLGDAGATAAGCSRPPAGAARHARRYRRRHARARDDVRDRRRAPCASSTACRRAASAPTSCARRGRRRARADAHGPRDPLRLRLDRARGSADVDGRPRTPIAGPDASVLRHAGADRTARAWPPSPISPSRPGERCPFVLTWHPSHRAAAPTPIDAERAVERHRRRGGASGRQQCTYDGDWRDAVHALAHHAEGADVRADRRDRRRADHVAARVDRRRAQLGLPLLLAARRDLHALRADASAAITTRRSPGATGCCAPSAGDPAHLQIMYGLAGERRLTEFELDWLPGYEGSAPVRVGNAASRAVPARRVRRGARDAAP